MEKKNNREMFFLNKSKRLDTIKKKARELSILCDIDVCLLGTHESQPDTWHTWPEDQTELDRVVNRYMNKVEEKESDKRAILKFDVDKALEGMSDEELRMVLQRVDQVSADVDNKLDFMLRNQSSSTHNKPIVLDAPSDTTMDEVNGNEFDSDGTQNKPIVLDSPSNPTMDEANCNEFYSDATHTTPMISDVPLDQTMKAANCDEYDSEDMQRKRA